MQMFYEHNGVQGVIDEAAQCVGIVGRHALIAEEGPWHRLGFCVNPPGTVTVSVEVAGPSGDLVNLTCEPTECRTGDTITISDDGILSVIAKPTAGLEVEFEQGFRLRLPAYYVEPVRLAIAKAWEMAAILGWTKVAA